VKLDPDGEHLWSRRFGGESHDWGDSVTVDSAGNVYVTGDFASSSIDFGAGPVEKPGDSYDEEWQTGGYDLFLLKLAPDGELAWARVFGGDHQDYGNSVAADPAGNVYVAGDFESSAIDFGGGALTNGSEWDSYACAPWSDQFVVKLDGQGNHVWSIAFSGAMNDHADGLFVDSGGRIYLVGDSTSSGIDYGGGPLPNGGCEEYWDPYWYAYCGSDVLVVKLEQ